MSGNLKLTEISPRSYSPTFHCICCFHICTYVFFSIFFMSPSTGSKFKPNSHLSLSDLSLATFSPSFNEAQYSFAALHPLSTHRNNPPAQYWVNEYLFSPFLIAVLECFIIAEGTKIVEPTGNCITSSKSCRTRCPPNSESYSPIAVMAQYPNAKLAKSTCRKQAVFGPKLYVTAVKMLLKGLLSIGLLLNSLPSVLS